MKSRVMRLLVCMALFGWMSIAFAADTARAWLDRDSMRLGETVTLNVETTDANAVAPDFSALTKDFDVGGTQSSQQVSIVNGARSAKMLWAVALQPRHEGRITIAPIAVGSASTAVLTLEVGAAAPPAQAGGEVFFEVDAQPRNPWVQQQVRYTVKLYYAVDLTGGNIDPPKADGLSAQHLGQDKQYVANVGGKRYQVVEQHYALTPERSGTIELPALQFRGATLDLRDPSSFFSRGRQISARSQPITLEVQPQPAIWPTDQPWLPAASLILQDESELPTQVHVGDAVTRTIRLQAQGLSYAQLPELQLPAIAAADVYPDKSDTRTRDDGDWLYGERVRKFAIVPRHAGNLTVPGVRVTWWNTQTARLETTQLPERSIEVLPALAGSGVAAPVPPSSAVSPPSTPTQGAAPSMAPTNPYAPLLADSQARFWRIAAALLLAAWLATAFGWWLHWRRAAQRVPDRHVQVDGTAGTHRAAFLRACSLGELAAAERALVAWSRSERSQVRNLGELARQLADAPQRDALARLQRVRYAGAAGDGLGEQLQAAFRQGIAWPAAASRSASAEPLPALYPERD